MKTVVMMRAVLGRTRWRPASPRRRRREDGRREVQRQRQMRSPSPEQSLQHRQVKSIASGLAIFFAVGWRLS